MLRHLVLLVAALSPAAAFGQDLDDAAHRADRSRTRQLNDYAGSVVDARNRRNADAQARYRAERAAYERRMDDWRRRVAACRHGDFDACEDR
jgi:hypothetical protein